VIRPGTPWVVGDEFVYATFRAFSKTFSDAEMQRADNFAVSACCAFEWAVVEDDLSSAVDHSKLGFEALLGHRCGHVGH
jgi:hypothetical protein